MQNLKQILMQNLAQKVLVLFLISLCLPTVGSAQFDIGGDSRVNPDDFMLTTFADSLNFPVGMSELADGSVIVGLSKGSFLASTMSSIVRLIDVDQDGISDQRQMVLDDIPIARMSDLQIVDNLLVVTGQGGAIIIYQFELQSDQLSLIELGQININYPDLWLHRHNTLAFRKDENSGRFEIYTNIGSDLNWEVSVRVPSYSTSYGLSGDLIGDSIYRFVFELDGQSLGSGLVEQIAYGLRSASGIAFEPTTGDMYFQDNGIDGIADPNEPVSADEINVIEKANIGGDVEYFGFPNSYTEYRTEMSIGGEGVSPLIAFQPFGNSSDGLESEGANDILFAPESFPSGLNNGLFVGFHGKFLDGGLANEENPLVFVDLRDQSYFHMISNMESGVGHLDGLAKSDSAIYIADISIFGSLGQNQQNTGRIYRLKVKEGISTSTSLDLPRKRFISAPFPNPFTSTVTVDIESLNTSLAEYRVTIVDQLGRIVYDVELDWARSSGARFTWSGQDMDGKDLSPGLYLLSISSSNHHETVSIVKMPKN